MAYHGSVHKFTTSKYIVYHPSIHYQTLQDEDVELQSKFKCREDQV